MFLSIPVRDMMAQNWTPDNKLKARHMNRTQGKQMMLQ